MRIAITGGAGYIGALAVRELVAGGHEVGALDPLLHEQEDVAGLVEQEGAELIRADVRDDDARRRLLEGADAVVHLGAIVGDPACAVDPEKSTEINVEASGALIADARAIGVARFVFASTCSNYGRMADPTVPIDETATLAPVSLYAEQKVKVERQLIESPNGLDATCLRFATVYGAAPRMRFDLTVNEFTRDLWADRELEVFGEQFWRPYVHVADAARAIRTVLESPADQVAGEVFNVGHSDENYRKVDLVELIKGRLGRGEVKYVQRDEDPRDYKVSFEKVRERLGFEPRMRVADGIDEIVGALEEERFGDPFDRRYSNLASAKRSS
ncbi:MAG: NAD(P)-dependent oxidoreductase [Thermoleophilaceae bacterium]